MRLLIVTQYFWPENFRINDLAEALRIRGHQITVLTGIPNYPSGYFFKGYGFFRRTRETWQGVDIVRAFLLPRGRASSIMLGLNYLSFAWFASILARFRLRGSFDAIFVFEVSPITVGIPAIVASRRFNAPIVFWVLDLWPESLTAAGGIRAPWILRAVDHLAKWIYRNCSRVLVQSRAFVPEIKRHGVPDSQIQYFPSWGEALFQPLQYPDYSLLPLLPGGFKILFAGNLGEAQDLPAVLRAAEFLRDHKDIHWLIVGDGRIAGWAKCEVQRRNLSQVHFLGRHPVELMPHFYAAADALLLTLKREPIFGLTIPGRLQSCLACAQPILAMLDGEGARIVEESGAGLTCPAGDADGLANQALKLAAMSKIERTTMGQNGRDYYKMNFDRTHLIDQLESWLKNTILESKKLK